MQFAKEEDAAKAIEQTNGVEFQGKKLEVFAHVKRSDNADEPKQVTGNNVFVQGFAKGTQEARLKEMFGGLGEITSLHINKNDAEDSLSNSAYICYKESQSAQKAVEQMNKAKTSEGTFLFVNHHVAKRQNDLATDKTKTAINQNINRNFSSNLFIKFVPTGVTEEELRQVFQPYGTIISIKLKSRSESRYNCAYVLYETVEMCQQAIRALDKSRPFGNQPIDVEFWVSKVDLQAEREAKQKEQMQKFFSSAIYELKNELNGGRGGKNFRQNRHHDMRKPKSATGGRGGKPVPSSERKNSKDTRNKSQNKDKQGTPQPTFATVPLPAPEAVAQLANITDAGERRQAIGNMIFPCIQQAYGPNYVGKITGMLLDEKVVNLQLLVTDQKYLSQIAGQAKNMLENQANKQQ